MALPVLNQWPFSLLFLSLCSFLFSSSSRPNLLVVLKPLKTAPSLAKPMSHCGIDTTIVEIIRIVVFSTYLFPAPAGVESTPEENASELQNGHSSADELQYSMVEDTFAVLPPIKMLDTLSPPRVKHKPTANPSLSASTLSSARLLERFTRWAAKTNLKLKRSSSARRVYIKVFQSIEDKSHSEFTCRTRGIRSNRTVLRRFRLNYIHSERLHEAPMAIIQSSFHDFFREIPYPKRRFLKINLLTNITKDGTIPDLRISMQNVRDPQLTLIIPAIGQTAFTQHLASLSVTLRTAVETNSALLMIIVTIVQELHPYSSPVKGSNAFNVWDDFHLAVGGGDPALDRPIVIEGHTWCSLRSVRFKSLFPLDNNMTAVHAMINRGAEAIRETLVELCQSMAPEMDLVPLRNPDIKFRLENEDFIDGPLAAMSETAYDRYATWYKNTPRPRKRGRAASQMDGPASNTRRSQRRQH
ncbi:hypothetical protein BD769DRAFT_1392541 [Suillus cothurnatus]|nr:hypothetical protein BD769DRAFT_1392541 [Suillus cothurnatus]